ncbi:MAG TPA: hypothetical protein VHB50_22240, partial [Bryobacteraceae bacterium]|nr:hypothetical protein [Bryobacteraceae bacterium]
AIALEDVLKRRPEWDAMGSRGQHFARRHMSWDRMAEIAERQYEELLGRLDAAGASFSEPAVGWRAG